jgi:hypothetical protein
LFGESFYDLPLSEQCLLDTLLVPLLSERPHHTGCGGPVKFRQELIDIYEGRCTISGWDASEGLEAAHIVPYLGPGSNHLSNGLLLRADLHTLFDLGLISVESDTMTVLLSDNLRKGSYAEFVGKQVRPPKPGSPLPSKYALDQHRSWSGL